MPLGLNLSHFIPDKIREYDCKLRAKDERIVALETENAMLYLKMAQLQGSVRSSHEESAHFRRMWEGEQITRKETVQHCMTLTEKAKGLREDLDRLKKFVQSCPDHFNREYEQIMAAVQKRHSLLKTHTSDLSDLQQRLMDVELSLQEATDRHAKEKKRRRELHNTLMELRGNIRVHCRLRPIMYFDTGGEDLSTLGKPNTLSEVICHSLDDENIVVRTPKNNKVFEFERVYAPGESQGEVFEEVQPMITSLLDGYNVCIAAYGQTGSGKTHTMIGSHKNEDYNICTDPQPDEGVIPRAVRELFRLISEKPADTHTVEVSVVEIYNNDIRDLLGRDPKVKHDVVTASDGSLSVLTLTSKSVQTVHDVMLLVQHGLKARREISTLIHEHSSRSHLVVTLTVSIQASHFIFSPPRTGSPTDVFAVPAVPPSKDHSQRRQLPQPQSAPNLSSYAANSKVTMRSRSPSPVRSVSATPTTPGVIRTKLQLVDLAGSECVGMSGVTGTALRETSYINKSLSALADVLGALAEHRSHVPYRNSRITHLLQDSIGGDAKLLMMLCVSPSKRYVTESVQTLGFGQRARQVQRGPIKRKLPGNMERIGPGDATYSGRNSPRPRSAGPPKVA